MKRLVSLCLTSLLLALFAFPASAAPRHKARSTDLAVNMGYGFGAGDTINVEITIVNNGGFTATDVKIDDSFDPAHVEFISAQGAETCNSSSGSVSCDIGSISSYASKSVTLSFNRKLRTGSTVNTASVSAESPDPDTTNNRRSLTMRLYFLVECSGFAPGPCVDRFTLLSPRTVEFRLTPQPGYVGYLEARLSSGLYSEPLAAVYATDGTSIGVTSRTVTLAPGDWTLTVGTRGVNVQGVNPPNLPPYCTPSFARSLGFLFLPTVCVPQLPDGWYGAYVPAGFGTLGAQVIEAGI